MAPGEGIKRSIALTRGQAVMFNTDLAALYGVTVKRLNEIEVLTVPRRARRGVPALAPPGLRLLQDAQLILTPHCSVRPSFPTAVCLREAGPALLACELCPN